MDICLKLIISATTLIRTGETPAPTFPLHTNQRQVPFDFAQGSLCFGWDDRVVAGSRRHHAKEITPIL
jgi:hypothetical protein